MAIALSFDDLMDGGDAPSAAPSVAPTRMAQVAGPKAPAVLSDADVGLGASAAPTRSAAVNVGGATAGPKLLSDDDLGIGMSDFSGSQRPSVAMDVAKSGGIGVAKGLIGIPGGAGDIGTLASMATDKVGGMLGASPEGIKRFKTEARDALAANPISRIAVGAMSVAPSSADIQHQIEKVTGDFYEPKTTPGHYAETIGAFLPAALGGPEALVPKVLKYGVAPAVASETAGQLTKGTAAEPWARGITGLVTGPATAIAANRIPRTVAPIASAARDYVAPMTEGGQQRLAGEALRARAANPDAVTSALDTATPDLVPNSKPTTFQLTGDMGLGSLERELATRDPAAFNVRRAEQNAARTQTLGGLQDSGSAADVSEFLRTQLRDVDASTDRAVNAATEGARSAAQRIGGTGSPESYGNAIRDAARPGLDAATGTARTAVADIGGAGQPEQYGAAMRGSLADARAAAKAHERQLWNAVDPDRTLSLNVDPLKQAAANIEARVSASARPIEGEERNILNVIGRYDSVTPFSELTDLRSRISAAMREEMKASGATANYSRLTALRGSVEDLISQAAKAKIGEDAQAVARGQMSPEQATAASLQKVAADRDAWNSQQNVGGRDGGGFGADRAVEAPAVSAVPGAQGEGGGGFPGAPGNPRLPQGPSPPAAAAAGPVAPSPQPFASAPPSAEATEIPRPLPGRTPPKGTGEPISLANVTEDKPLLIQFMSNRTGSQGAQTFGNQDRIVRVGPDQYAVISGSSVSMMGSRAQVEGYYNSPARAGYRREVLSFGSPVAKKFGALDDADYYHPLNDQLEILDHPGPAAPEGGGPAPNFDQGARDRLTAATTATRERVQTFDKGSVGQTLRTDGMQGQYRTLDAAVPATVFRPGPGGFQAAEAFRRAAGNDQAALGALQDYAAASLRRAAERSDGSLDPARYAAWRRQHQDALRAIPGLRERFDAAARASEPLDAFRPVAPEITAAHVPESFFHSGPGGFEDVQQLRGLIGDDRTRAVLGDYAASRLRQAAIREDGTLDPAKFATWRRQHQDALRAFPELDGRFADAAHATEAIGEAAAARKAALDAHQQGAIGRLVGVNDPQDVTRVVGGIFGRADAAEQMGRLADATAGDHAARAGLRKAVVDRIVSRFTGNTEAATSGESLLKSDGFQTFVRTNRATLEKVFSPEEMSTLSAIAADLKRANRSIVAVKLPGQSNTAQDLLAAPGRQVSLLRKIVTHAADVATAGGAGAGAGSFFGPLGTAIGSAAGVVGGGLITAAREAGITRVDELLKQAMLDPNVARMLLTRASAAPDRGPAMRLAQYFHRQAGLSLFQATGAAARTDTGERDRPVELRTSEDVDHGAERTATPSPAQAEAGNYAKRHIVWKGLDIAVETERGQDRAGVGADGKPWSTTMAHPYGYFKGTLGHDGDAVDLYVGPHPHVPRAFVFDQIDPANGRFDEHKLVVGARDLDEARSIYDSGFSDASGPHRRGAVREMSVAELKQWLAKGDLTKPVAYDPASRSTSDRFAGAFGGRRTPPSLQDLFADPRSAADIRKELA